jgi:PilZ domain
VTVGDGERRRATRRSHVDDHGILAAQVRPGYQALVIDISANGALIETERPLLPGTAVELVLERRQYRAGIKARVLRCAIVRLYGSSVVYRGAVVFDRSLPWFVEPDRADVAQQVV